MMPTSGVKWSRCSRRNESAQHFIEEPVLDAAAKALSTRRSPGSGIGPYQVVSLLGSGGMGDVYRARDPQLDRDVAIKVLPAVFLGDPERLARFHREARVLASMNHPHIGAIYGVEQEPAGRPALVLELVEGPTLAERLRESHARLRLAGRRGAGDCVADRQGARSRPREGDYSPRPQAREYQADRQRNRESARFRAGQGGSGRRRRGRSDCAIALPISEIRPDVILGTAGVHEPGAGTGRHGGQAHRRLGVRLRALRDADADNVRSTARRRLTRWHAFWNGNPTGRRARRYASRPSARCFSAACARIRRQRLHDVADARIEIDECRPRRVPAAPAERGVRGALVVDRRRQLVVASLLLAIVFVRLRAPEPSSELFEFPGGSSGQSDVSWRLRRICRGARRTAGGRDRGIGRRRKPLGAAHRRASVSPDSRNGRRLLPVLEAGWPRNWLLRRREAQDRGAQRRAPTVVCDAPERHEGSGRDEVGGTWNRDDIIVFMSSAFTLQKVPARAGAVLRWRSRRSATERRRIAGPRFCPTGGAFSISRWGNRAIWVSCASDRWMAPSRCRSDATNRMRAIQPAICCF